ncbi:MAG: thioredoxin, partial [Muribaculaceae bacterium]|nr:thioredoxin [Muribaculaceae bacterium]
MKKNLFLIALTLFASVACISCSDKPRTIENPLISAGNTTTLDIASVNLNDSSTILTINAYYTPNWWIRIASDTRLEADGKRYALISAEGIELDKEFYMPESGEAQFTLTFEPLPLSTKKFDFIEGDGERAFQFWDVDLTRSTPPAYPEGLPAELKKEPRNVSMPEPVFEIGETTVNIHLLNNRPVYKNDWSLLVNTMYGKQEQLPFKVDEEGNAVIKFNQYGTAQLIPLYDNGNLSFSNLWVNPGETVNIYLDMNRSGANAMRHRDNFKPTANQWTYS